MSHDQNKESIYGLHRVCTIGLLRVLAMAHVGSHCAALRSFCKGVSTMPSMEVSVPKTVTPEN